jgi:hypothetical protein
MHRRSVRIEGGDAVARHLGQAVAVRRIKGPKGLLRWSVLYPEEGFAIIVTMKEVFGQVEIVGLEIDPLLNTVAADIFDEWPPTIITSELLRSIPLSKLKAACLSDLAGRRENTFLEEVAGVPKRGQAPIPVAKIKQVAGIYQESVRLQQNPIKRIEEEMEVKASTARKYVRRARDLGLLGFPESPGVAGTSSSASPITGRSPDASTETRNQ